MGSSDAISPSPERQAHTSLNDVAMLVQRHADIGMEPVSVRADLGAVREHMRRAQANSAFETIMNAA